MIETTELGKQTFATCEEQFLRMPTSCNFSGQCDPSIELPIIPVDLEGLGKQLDGISGGAALEIYPNGNSFTVELKRPEDGMLNLTLTGDGHLILSEIPGKNSPDYPAFQEWLRSDPNDVVIDTGEPEYVPLSVDMAQSLVTLAGRLVTRALRQD